MKNIQDIVLQIIKFPNQGTYDSLSMELKSERFNNFDFTNSGKLIEEFKNQHIQFNLNNFNLILPTNSFCFVCFYFDWFPHICLDFFYTHIYLDELFKFYYENNHLKKQWFLVGENKKLNDLREVRIEIDKIINIGNYYPD